MLVYAHHQGLPDSAVEARRTETACFRDKRETVRNYIDQELEHLLDIHQSLVSQNFKHVPEYCVGDPAMFFRMVFSCLVDADHSNTAACIWQYPEQETYRNYSRDSGFRRWIVMSRNVEMSM